jgi:hypothetical protein
MSGRVFAAADHCSVLPDQASKQNLDLLTAIMTMPGGFVYPGA